MLVMIVLAGGALYTARLSEGAPRVVYTASLEGIEAESQNSLSGIKGDSTVSGSHGIGRVFGLSMPLTGEPTSGLEPLTPAHYECAARHLGATGGLAS